MLGWGGVVCICGGRCLKQDLRDFLGIFGMGDALWWSGWAGWDVAVGGCGRRCLKQDLRDFLGIFGMGVAHGIKEKIGWKDWQDD